MSTIVPPVPTGPRTAAVVLLLSEGADLLLSLRELSTLLAPFSGEVHLLGVPSPLLWPLPGSEHPIDPGAATRADPVNQGEGAIAKALGVDPARIVLHAARPDGERAVLDVVQDARPLVVLLGPRPQEAKPWQLSNQRATGILRKASLPVALLRGEHERPPRRIVVATDFSPHADRAFDLATAWAHAWARAGDPLAEPRPVEVELLHISDFARPGRLVSERMAAYSERLGAPLSSGSPEVLHSTRVLSAPIAPDGIQEAIEGSPPDLLFLGTHGHGPLGLAVFGSVAQEVLRRATCSVVVVPLPR